MRIRLSTLFTLASPLAVLVLAAYVQWLMAGRPLLPTYPAVMPQTMSEPHGFPDWICVTHYVNFLFLILLIRSGLQILNGAVFIALLLATDQWRRLVPTSWSIFPDAWAVWVNYVTFHLPPEPDGFYFYNPLQQLAYFGVVFVLAPLSIITGPAMSPALVNRFSWYRHLPGNRQVGRSLHFLALCGYVLFTLAHVTMVAITGFARNMNHITIGTDDGGMMGVYLFIVGMLLILGANVGANWISSYIPASCKWSAAPL